MKLLLVKFSLVFFFLFINISSNALLAQLTVGEVPPGYSLHESDFMIELKSQFAAYNLLDLNFDGEDDIKLTLSKTSNGAKKASISLENDSIGICHKLEFANHTPAAIHEEGSILNCDLPFGFELHPALVGIGLGRFDGGPVEELPSILNEEYIHYEWKTDTGAFEGWLKISFDLTTDTLSLTVHEWIVKDELTSTIAPKKENKVTLFPNPVQDGILHFASDENIKSIEIYNLQGQLLRSITNFEDKVQVGDYHGMVVVKLQMEKGTHVEMIFIK